MSDIEELDIRTLVFASNFMRQKLEARRIELDAIPASSANLEDALKNTTVTARGLGYAEACRDFTAMVNSILAQTEVLLGARVN